MNGHTIILLMGLETDMSFNREAVAQELVGVVKLLVAAMPGHGRERGMVKGSVKKIVKRAGWDYVSVNDTRDGSGFNVYAHREIENLPDFDASGGRDRTDIQKELNRDMKPLLRKLENLKIRPNKVVGNITLSRSRGVGMGDPTANLHIYLRYSEGAYTTPLGYE